MQNHRAIERIILITIFLSGIALLYKYWDSIRVPDPPSVITPPIDQGFEGVTLERAACMDWAFQALTVIPADKIVKVLGRNQDSTWYYVRWPEFTMECWVIAYQVQPDNFSPAGLFIISAPFPPPTDPVVTLTFTSTSTSTPTLTLLPDILPSVTGTAPLGVGTTPLPTDRPAPTNTANTFFVLATNTATIPPTATNTLVTVVPFTPTSTSTATYTSTPTATPTPSYTSPPPCQAPDTPHLTSQRFPNMLELQWTSIPGTTGYQVYKAIDTGDFNLLGVSTETSLRVSIPQLAANRYYVVAVSACGASSPSNILTISH